VDACDGQRLRGADVSSQAPVATACTARRRDGFGVAHERVRVAGARVPARGPAREASVARGAAAAAPTHPGAGDRAPGGMQPVRHRQRAQADQHVALGVAGIGAHEEVDVGRRPRAFQRRGAGPQPLAARAHDDALRRTPVRAVDARREPVDQRLHARRGRLVVAWPVIAEVARQQQVALPAEGVEEPVDASERMAQALGEEAAEADLLQQVAPAHLGPQQHLRRVDRGDHAAAEHHVVRADRRRSHQPAVRAAHHRGQRMAPRAVLRPAAVRLEEGVGELPEVVPVGRRQRRRRDDGDAQARGRGHGGVARHTARGMVGGREVMEVSSAVVLSSLARLALERCLGLRQARVVGRGVSRARRAHGSDCQQRPDAGRQPRQAQCTSTGYVPRILKNPHTLRSSSSAVRTCSWSGWPAMSR